MEKTLLNLIPGACSPEVHLSQYDKGRAVPFKLAEGKSAYSVPDGSEIVVQATKPSGLGFVVPVTFDGDTATMTITETMSNEYGRFPAELSITNNGNKIGTANFVMNIERSPHPEGTIDGDAETIIPELTLLVERIESAASSVLDMQVVANTLPAGSQATYSYDESLNKATFGIPQGEPGAGAIGTVASAYDASKTYAVGDYAIHNNDLYRCITAITTAETFTASHWAKIVLVDDVTDLKSDLNSQAHLMLESGTYSDASVGTETHKVNNVYRIRCAYFIPVNRYFKIATPTNYVMWIGCLDDTEKVVSGGSNAWVSEYYTAKLPSSAKYLTIVIKKTDGTDISSNVGEVTRGMSVVWNPENLNTPIAENLLNNSRSVKDLKSAPYINSTATELISTSVGSNWDGERRFYMSGAKYIRVDFPQLEKGKLYTFSCDFTRCENSTQNSYITIGNVKLLFTAPKESWSHAEFSFIADDDTTYAKVGIDQPSDGWVASARKFMLNEGSGVEWKMSAEDMKLQEELNILGIHIFPTKGQLNVIKRARQLTDVKWSPIADLTRISKQGDDSRSIDGLWFEDKFDGGKEYLGFPYSETNHVQNYGYIRKAHIGETIGFETFLTSARNANSALMTESQYRQAEHSATLYGVVCSSLVCYAIGQRNVMTGHMSEISGMVDKGILATVGIDTIDVCDILLYAGFHTSIITDIKKDGNGAITDVEISEATPNGNESNIYQGGELGGVCRRRWWSAEEFIKAWGVYRVWKYDNTSEVEYKPCEVVPMLNEGNYMTPLTMACMPYMGNKFIYIKGSIPSTKLLISASGYNTLVVKKDGSPWQTFSITDETEDVDVGFSDEGTYEAYLAIISNGSETNRTLSCKWRVSTATITISIADNIATFVCTMPDGFDTPISAILKGNTDDLYPWVNLTDVTKEELSGGSVRYTFSIPVPSNANGYGRVAFENEFGCWHSGFVAYN